MSYRLGRKAVNPRQAGYEKIVLLLMCKRRLHHMLSHRFGRPREKGWKAELRSVACIDFQKPVCNSVPWAYDRLSTGNLNGCIPSKKHPYNKIRKQQA